MNEENVNIPLRDKLDSEILLHRDCHFAGQFDLMLDYYRQEGVGVRDEFPLERLEELAAMEKALGADLAGNLLSGSEAELVARVREKYRELRDIYEIEKPISDIPRLIADLILSEDPTAQQEIEALCAKGSIAVPSLIELLQSDELHDPLFPGYGRAPYHALACLERIGDKKAITVLFEHIGNSAFFEEERAVQALYKIGTAARDFLLKVLQSKPFNEDNERAAIALVPFKDDPLVSQSALQMLQENDLRKQIPLATYLVLCCEGLDDAKQRDAFMALRDKVEFPRDLHTDIKLISRQWK